MSCDILKLSPEVQRQRDIIKTLLENKTPALVLESFIKKINTSGHWNEFINLSGEKLIEELTKELIDNTVPAHKRYIHQGSRSLRSMNDFNRDALTVQERREIRETIKFNIVNRCLFDISGKSGKIHPLEKINENILAYRLSIMLDLAAKLDIQTPIKNVEDVLYRMDDGEQVLQNLLYEIETKYDANIADSELKVNYYAMLYFDTILLSIFENVIEFASEYNDDGHIYLHKYVYKGPGSNMRKGHQDKTTEGFADAFENMANLTKTVTEFIPKYMIVNGKEINVGYIGSKNAVYLFAELWEFVINTSRSHNFEDANYINNHRNFYKAVKTALDTPASADWGVIVNEYITSQERFKKFNEKGCMLGLYKHVFEKGRGTWLYDDFISCIQKYRKTYYGVVSKVRHNKKPYLEYNELESWTDQRANFRLQDQIGNSTVANHIIYDTDEKRKELAKRIGLSSTKGSSAFTIKINGYDLEVNVIKSGDQKTSFEIKTHPNISKEDILQFLLTEMGINVSKDALLYLQSEIHGKDSGLVSKTGDVLVKAPSYFNTAIAPVIGIWVNSVFDKEIVIDGENVFTPSIAFPKKRYGNNEIDIYNYSDYFPHLAVMSEILQVVHHETTSNVIKNIKGHNVPTTQLATIQQDGPVLNTTVAKAEQKKIDENKAKFGTQLPETSKTTGFKSISKYNPTLSQLGFCTEKTTLAGGIENGPFAKESKELKAGELTHWEIMYLFAQQFFDGKDYIYSQSTANADKNLQTFRGLNLNLPIEYYSFKSVKHQDHTLRSIIEASMNGDDSGIFEYYKLHNAQSLLALENNICHSYNCAFRNEDGWNFTNNIEEMMSQLARKRYEYLQLSKAERKGKFDWTLSSVKKRFKQEGLDFNETTFGIEAPILGNLYGKSIEKFNCVQFPKDMVRDFQIAKRIAAGGENEFELLKKQSDTYERYFIQDLISENCDINTITDNYFKHLIKENKKSIPLLKNWVSRTGDMILAKFNWNGETVELTTYSNSNDIANFKKATDIQVNPILHAYHVIQFAVNTQMTEAYNGTRFSIGVKKDKGCYIKSVDNFEIITPNTTFDTNFTSNDDETKKKNNALEEIFNEIKLEWEKDYLKVENARMVDYYKRATVNGTREHRILHGGKYTIPEIVHTATIADPEGVAILNSNESKVCKAQDGSIWVTPWHALQIDAGSGEAKLPPGVRKTMYHDIDPITGGATLLKMAEYVITNEMRRMSQKGKMNMDNLLMKLANRTKIKLNNSKDVQLAIMNLNSFFDGNIFYEQQYYYPDETFGYYYAFKIQVELDKDGRLVFHKSKKRVNKDGKDIDTDFGPASPFKIDTIYQIDRIFGGCYSCDLTKDGLELGESQNKIVNQIICELDLKDNYTAYAVNKESIKNNIKNVNSASEWFDVSELKYKGKIEELGELSELWTSDISTKFGGIILNALHEMDEDVDVARGVQMLSEMIQNGNQYGDVEKIYSNVRLGIQEALKDYVEALNSDKNETLQNLIFDTIINSLSNSKDKSKTTMAQEFVLSLKTARDEKQIDILGFPISDKALYDLLITTIVGKINKEGIRARNSGFGGVKHPSFGIADIFEIYIKDGVDKKNQPIIRKLYGKHHDLLKHVVDFLQSEEGQKSGWSAEKLLSEVSDKDSGELNPLIALTKSSVFNVDLGETIVYQTEKGFESFEIASDREYQYFKRSIEPTITEFYRNIFAGRRLRGYRTECTYNDNGVIKHNMLFNTDSRYLSSSIFYVRDVFDKLRTIIKDELLYDEIVDEETKEVIKINWETPWNFWNTVYNAYFNKNRSEKESEYLKIFEKNCKSLTRSKLNGNVLKDLHERILFIQRFFNNEEFERFVKNLLAKETSMKERSTLQSVLDAFTSISSDDKLMLLWNGDVMFNNSDFKKVMDAYLEQKRLIGVNKFVKEKKLEFTKTGETVQQVYDIISSTIRKAEYMKSKGNIAKQYMMGRGDSMYDVMSKGYKYFEEKLRQTYAYPTEKSLVYDVIIYDKSRRPIFVKYDPDYNYADRFVKNDEYFAIRNGLFREQNGKVYYKSKEVCSSNKMSSWIKHGENGEKYTVLTVFDWKVFKDIVGGTYGKRDGFVDKVIPNLNELTQLDIEIGKLEYDEEAFLSEWNNFNGSHLTLKTAKNDLKYQHSLQNDQVEFVKRERNAFIERMIEEHLISRQWNNATSVDVLNSWFKQEAKRMFASFKKQLSAIGTRIPSQAMQSMMAMECVGYIDADYNEEMASIEMTYIQGSDYDIDKDYITEYFVDENGFVSDGSKLQTIEAFDEFIDELPVPNGGEDASFVKRMRLPKLFESSEKVFTISYDDAGNLINWLKNPETFDSDEAREQFEKFKEILQATNKRKVINIALEGYPINYITTSDFAKLKGYVKSKYGKEVLELLNKSVTVNNKSNQVFLFKNGNVIENVQYLISEFGAWARKYNKEVSEIILNTPNYIGRLNTIAYYIDLHQSSIVTTEKSIQNISLTKELEILSNPMNIASMEVSVDLSMDELKEFANEKGVLSENGLSVWSAASKFKAQDTNLLGKTGVGVAANADKVYFSVYYYHTKILNKIAKEYKNTPESIINNLVKVLIQNPFNDEDIRCISKLNWDILKDVPNFSVQEALENSDVDDYQKALIETMINSAVQTLNDPAMQDVLDFHDSDVTVKSLTFSQLLVYLKHISDQVDGTILLSALVSAATDNAKELILSKLNAFGDILDAYGMCATLGIPFEDTATIFTSPLLNVCVKDIRGDVFDISNFISKLEGSFGMYFADFTNSFDYTKINSRLSASNVIRFTKDLERNPNALNYRNPGNNVLFDVVTLLENNNTIDDIIVLAKTDVENYFNENWNDDDFDFDFMAEEDYESFDEIMIQKDVSWSESKPIQKLAYISYLKRLKLRNNAIISELLKNSAEAVDEQITNLKNMSEKLMPKLYEQQILHKMLGVTKGIEGKPYQLYRYIRELEYFVTKKYKNYNKDNEQTGKALIEEEFDFVKFFTDSEYANKHIKTYENVRELTNILECLKDNEYIGEMLKTVGITNQLLTRVSFVYGNTQKIAKVVEQELNLSRPLTEKEYALISRLVNEWMVYQFLTYHSDHSAITMNLSSARNEKKYTGVNFQNPIDVLEDSVLEINEMCDIETFKRLANLSLFRDLLEDYSTHSDRFSKNKMNPTNMFVEAIVIGGFVRTIPNFDSFVVKPEITWRVAYNLNEDISDETSDYAQQLKKDFEYIYDLPLRYKEVTIDPLTGKEIIEWKDRGITIGDFIYLYNLIVYKNSGTQYSFTKLFENSEELRKKSKILPQYNAFVAAMDGGFRTYDFASEKFFMDSVLLRLGVMKNSKLVDKVAEKKSEIYHSFVENVDYPFDFTMEVNPINKTDEMAQFYDEMTKIITQNTTEKTSATLPEPGIYYVQKSMLPEDPSYFLSEISDKFALVNSFKELNKLDVDNKYIIVTDPKFVRELDDYNIPIKAAYVHSELEFVKDSINDILGNKVINLNKNSNFTTILENTLIPDIHHKRPILLQDSMRKLWNATSLPQDGFAFNDYVKFVTLNDTENYTDHRKFAKAWFEYANDNIQIYVNLDACDNENVILHEIAHFLLLMNKLVDIDKYHNVANSFLKQIYGDDADKINAAWNQFKEQYPKTANGGYDSLTDDFLFDEFLINSIMKMEQSDVNINNLVSELRKDMKKHDIASYQLRLRSMSIISQKIKSGEFKLNCE